MTSEKKTHRCHKEDDIKEIKEVLIRMETKLDKKVEVFNTFMGKILGGLSVLTFLIVTIVALLPYLRQAHP